LVFVFMTLMIAAFFFGGIFAIPFLIMVYLVFYYIIFKIARSLDGDKVLNFFGILFLLNALYNFAILLLLNLLLDEPIILLLNLFILSVGLILKFFQKRMVVTAALAIHTLLVIVGMVLGAKTGSPILSPLLTVAINIGLITYVNVIRGLPKDGPSLESLIPPE
jgi:hypothetical protein